MVGIYKVTSPSGRIYVGQSFEITERRFDDYRRLRCKGQKKLHASLVKYGSDAHSFDVVCELPKDVDVPILVSYEQFVMDQLREAGIELLNLREAGSRGRHSEESKKRISEANKGRVPWAKGRAFSGEHRRRISESNKGKKMPPHTEEAKRKIGEASIGRHLGKKRTPEQCARIGAASTGRKQSEESIKKRADSLTGVKRPKETVEKIKIKLTGRKMTPEQIKKSVENRKLNNNGSYTKQKTGQAPGEKK